MAVAPVENKSSINNRLQCRTAGFKTSIVLVKSFPSFAKFLDGAMVYCSGLLLLWQSKTPVVRFVSLTVA